MLWAGALSTPLILTWTAVNYDGSAGIAAALMNVTSRLVFVFLFAGVAAVIYEIFFLKRFKIVSHPHRAKLSQLLLGPIIFLLLVLFFHISGTISLLMGFLTEVLVLVYHRKELFWEAIVAGLFMAIIYVIVFALVSRVTPSAGFSLISGFSGLDIFGLPLEALLFVFGYGMLWGPLYEGVKREKVK